MKNKFLQQRKFVNSEFGKAMKGKSLSISKKRTILRKLWKEAKKRFK